MAKLADLRVNVAALKQVDPYVKEILGTATQVALYTFNPQSSEWKRTEVEGALFVYSRNGEPFNSMLIMNRLNRKNLVEPIIKELDWQMQAPFLLYRNSKNNIYGIWFYNKEECVNITYLLEGIMESISNKQPEKNNIKRTEVVDIFSMLSKAQQDFNKAPKAETDQASSVRPDVTSQSVMDFFAKASTSSTTNHQVPARAHVESEQFQPLLQRLMSNPAHSVEHIEKQQRATTPDQKQTLASHSLINKAKQDMPHRIADNFKIQPTVNPYLPSVSQERSSQLLENGLNFVRIPSPNPGTSPRGPFFIQSQPILSEDESRIASPPLATVLDTPQKPALMPPIMFTSSVSKEKPEKLIVPENTDGPEPLTRKQMLQAFNYLLKNDPEFVTKLHEAYVKSFSEMVS